MDRDASDADQVAPPAPAAPRGPRPLGVLVVCSIVIALLTLAALYVSGVLSVRATGPMGAFGDQAPPRIWFEQYTAVTKFKLSADSESTGDMPAAAIVTKATLEHDLGGSEAVREVAEELELLSGLPRRADGTLTVEGLSRSDEIVSDIRQGIRARHNGEIVTLGVTSRDADLATRITNLLVTNYVNRTSERVVSKLRAMRDFSLKQTNDCQSRLNDLHKARLDYESRYGQGMPNSPAALRGRTETLTDRLDALRIREETTRIELKKLKNLLKSDRGDASGALRTRVVALEAQLEVTTAEKARAKERIDSLTRQVSDLPPIRLEHLATLGKIKKDQQELDTWRQRYKAAQLELATETARKRTQLMSVQRAEHPTRPDPLLDFRGRAASMLVIAPATGLFGGVLLALLSLRRRRPRRRDTDP